MKTKKYTPYKYNLHEWLWKLPTQEDYEIVMKMLPLHLGVSKETFKKWIYIKQDSPASIPTCAMFKLCKFFEKTLDDIYTVAPMTFNFYKLHTIPQK